MCCGRTTPVHFAVAPDPWRMMTTIERGTLPENGENVWDGWKEAPVFRHILLFFWIPFLANVGPDILKVPMRQGHVKRDLSSLQPILSHACTFFSFLIKIFHDNVKKILRLRLQEDQNTKCPLNIRTH
ncbi:hypothetical protein NPIL_173241 [Nephila pilipes]|uniref:Uncharacterized protein n=1 Tax=Nephila pilipes TaxID=299642 RepID=A0A8X6QRQ2_NEPPI|nr:hypothetical protein NPIL_173241 [Nephila pilipes]